MKRKGTLLFSTVFGITIAFIIYTQKWVTTEELPWLTVLLGIVAGVIGGAWFAFIWNSNRYTARKPVPAVPQVLEEEEFLLKQENANHLLGEEGVRGTLLLTNKRLLFISDQLSEYAHQIYFPLREIAAIRKYRPKFMLSFKLKAELEITLVNFTTYRFTVQNVDRWINALQLGV